MTAFAIMDAPAMVPEILSTPAGPYFIVQFLQDTYLLSALHSYSDTLSVNRNMFLFHYFIFVFFFSGSQYGC